MMIGIDAVIAELQAKIQEQCAWINTVHGRAYLHREKIGKKVHEIPKVWTVQNEYLDVRPNDFNGNVAFFFVSSEESALGRQIEFSPNEDLDFSADIALIVWLNTELLKNHSTGPSITDEKISLIKVLKSSDRLLSIDSIIDQDAEEIFKEFTIEDVNTQYLMLPFGGLRFNFKIRYHYSQC